MVLASIFSACRRKCSSTYRSNGLVFLVEGSHVSRVFVVLYNVLVIASGGNLEGRHTSAGGDCAGGSSGGKRQHGGNERVVGLIVDLIVTEIVFYDFYSERKGAGC